MVGQGQFKDSVAVIMAPQVKPSNVFKTQRDWLLTEFPVSVWHTCSQVLHLQSRQTPDGPVLLEQEAVQQAPEVETKVHIPLWRRPAEWLETEQEKKSFLIEGFLQLKGERTGKDEGPKYCAM